MVRRAALWSVALWPLCAAQQGAPNDAAAPPVRCNESWIRGPGRLGRYGIVTSYNHRPKVDKYQRMRLNKLCYAQRHGYTFIEEKNVGWSHSCVAGAGPCKITQVVRWLPRFDWLLWYDLDIAITNPGPGVFEALTARNASDGMPLFTAEPGAAWRPFEADFARARGPAEWAAWLRSYAPVRALDVDDGVAVILTDHSIAINAGAVLIRNSANGRAFARRWLGVMRQVHPNLPFRDNGALLEAVAMASPEYLARGRPCLAIGEAEALKGEDEHQKVFDFFKRFFPRPRAPRREAAALDAGFAQLLRRGVCGRVSAVHGHGRPARRRNALRRAQSARLQRAHVEAAQAHGQALGQVRDVGSARLWPARQARFPRATRVDALRPAAPHGPAGRLRLRPPPDARKRAAQSLPLRRRPRRREQA